MLLNCLLKEKIVSAPLPFLHLQLHTPLLHCRFPPCLPKNLVNLSSSLSKGTVQIWVPTQLPSL